MPMHLSNKPLLPKSRKPCRSGPRRRHSSTPCMPCASLSPFSATISTICKSFCAVRPMLTCRNGSFSRSPFCSKSFRLPSRLGWCESKLRHLVNALKRTREMRAYPCAHPFKEGSTCIYFFIAIEFCNLPPAVTEAVVVPSPLPTDGTAAPIAAETTKVLASTPETAKVTISKVALQPLLLERNFRSTLRMWRLTCRRVNENGRPWLTKRRACAMSNAAVVRRCR